MSMPDAFFVREGPDFVATEHTRGPWSPLHQHGGPPSALLAHGVEDMTPRHGPMRVVRMTVEFLRPIPIGRFELKGEVIREGRKTQWTRADLFSQGERVATALALKIREESIPVPAVPLPTVDRPAPPDRCRPFVFPFFGESTGYHTSMELRFAKGEFGRGLTAGWFRARRPVIEGQPITPLQRVMLAADSGNGISMVLDVTRYTFINPDLTVYLGRMPKGEWVCLDAATIPDSDGIGLTESRLFDEEGSIGHSLQSLVIDSRRSD